MEASCPGMMGGLRWIRLEASARPSRQVVPVLARLAAKVMARQRWHFKCGNDALVLQLNGDDNRYNVVLRAERSPSKASWTPHPTAPSVGCLKSDRCVGNDTAADPTSPIRDLLSGRSRTRGSKLKSKETAVWTVAIIEHDGTGDFLNDAGGDGVALYPSRRRAEEVAALVRDRLGDEVQNVSAIRYYGKRCLTKVRLRA
jgi:hypothetical protein